MFSKLKALFTKSKLIAVINNVEYDVEITDNGRYALVFDMQDGDFMGRFILEGSNLVEYFPMSNTEIVIGRVE